MMNRANSPRAAALVTGYNKSCATITLREFDRGEFRDAPGAEGLVQDRQQRFQRRRAEDREWGGQQRSGASRAVADRCTKVGEPAHDANIGSATAAAASQGDLLAESNFDTGVDAHLGGSKKRNRVDIGRGRHDVLPPPVVLEAAMWIRFQARGS